MLKKFMMCAILFVATVTLNVYGEDTGVINDEVVVVDGFTFNKTTRTIEKVDRDIYYNSEQIIIPDYIDSIPVEVLGEYSFMQLNAHEFKIIKLPEYLKEICTGAFSNCKGLEEIFFKGNILGCDYTELSGEPFPFNTRGLKIYCAKYSEIYQQLKGWETMSGLVFVFTDNPLMGGFLF